LSTVGLIFAALAWLSIYALYWINLICGAVTLICVFVLLPSLIFKRSRRLAAVGFVYASFVFGFNCWLYSFAVVREGPGLFWLIIGFIMAGIGVFPIAIVSSAVQRDWLTLWLLIRAFGFMAIARFVGWITFRWLDRESQQLS
jgi:apolipoprotein N-acyltransferase